MNMNTKNYQIQIKTGNLNFFVILAAPAAAQPVVGINLGTNTTQSIAAPALTGQLTFSQVEELINKYTSELEEQEKVFINQATQVNTWDNLLNENSKKVKNNYFKWRFPVKITHSYIFVFLYTR